MRNVSGRAFAVLSAIHVALMVVSFWAGLWTVKVCETASPCTNGWHTRMFGAGGLALLFGALAGMTWND